MDIISMHVSIRWIRINYMRIFLDKQYIVY
jgi:hypothetical protein